MLHKEQENKIVHIPNQDRVILATCTYCTVKNVKGKYFGIFVLPIASVTIPCILFKLYTCKYLRKIVFII